MLGGERHRAGQPDVHLVALLARCDLAGPVCVLVSQFGGMPEFVTALSARCR